MAKQAPLVEEFDFVSEPSRDYFCPVSLEVMLNPRQTDCCGSHISSSAAERLANENKHCPMCNAPSPDPQHRGSGRTFTTHRDQYFQRIILDLKVRCPHRGRGCEWVGPLREERDHSASCGCRPWICQHCMLKTTYKVGMSEHAQKCPQRPVHCACSATPIPHSKYEDHTKRCPVQVVSCDFADVGCASQIRRKDLVSHLEEHLHHHQLLVSRKNLMLTLAIQSNLAGSKKETTLEKLQQQLDAKEAKISELQKKMTKLNAELNNVQKEVIKLQGELKDKAEVDNKMILDKFFEERDRGLQMNRLQEQMQVRDEEIQYLQERRGSEMAAENIESNIVVAITDIVEELKPKNSLQGKDIKALVAKLEEILVTMTDGKSSESDSISNDGYIMPPSPVNVPTAEQGKDHHHIFQGRLEKTLIKGLKRAWGLAVAGQVVYVVDTNGSHGLHVISGGTVKPMIESATFSDVHIPPGKCWYPRCVAIDKDLNILLADTSSHRVLKFSPRGKLLAHAGTESSAGSSSGEFNSPMGIGIDLNGRIFVCDRFNHRVQILDSQLECVSTFGQNGSGLLEFCNPWDVAFDSQGNVYIADCGNRCVKVFSPEISPLRDVGKGEGRYKIGDLRAPYSICIDSKDNLYVADGGLRTVLVFNSAGIYTASFGRFLEPNGICVDSKGRVYVSDNGGRTGILSGYPGRVQVFT